MEHKEVRHHEDLRVWKAAIVLAKDVYRFTAQLPAAEMYGLCAQLRRASTSIAANIAEGAARGSSRDFARFVSMAQGSLAELETHLILAYELYGLQRDSELKAQITTLRRMLIRLRVALKARK
jgi:four helix bundle protein